MSASDAAVDFAEGPPVRGRAQGVSNSSSSKQERAGEARKLLPRRAVRAVMLCLILGLALVGPIIQHALEVRKPDPMHVHANIGASTGEAAAHSFTQTAGLVQWGKFAMTMGQDVLLFVFTLAMSAVTTSLMIPALFVTILWSSWLGRVLLCLGLVEVGTGLFERTYLNVAARLCSLTRSSVSTGFLRRHGGCVERGL